MSKVSLEAVSSFWGRSRLSAFFLVIALFLLTSSPIYGSLSVAARVDGNQHRVEVGKTSLGVAVWYDGERDHFLVYGRLGFGHEDTRIGVSLHNLRPFGFAQLKVGDFALLGEFPLRHGQPHVWCGWVIQFN